MIIVACRRHPLYKAKRQPRCNCPACWAMWNFMSDQAWAIAKELLRVTQ